MLKQGDIDFSWQDCSTPSGVADFVLPIDLWQRANKRPVNDASGIKCL
jgi:hypothetical protein